MSEHPRAIEIEFGGTTVYIQDVARIDSLDGTGSTATFHISLEAGEWNEQSIDRFLDLHFPSRRCTHSYDCCGNWYGGRGEVIEKNSTELMVQQHSHMNV
tara:strand:- start:1090 stop:1389 length:300 start_codon:yes stop_codon:yes gene_type:complete